MPTATTVVEHGTGPVTMQFTIDLTSAAASAVTVNYQTSNSSAIAGTDYTAATGTLTIAAGTTSGIIPVGVLPDQAATTNRVFYLSLSGAVGATIATPKLSGTIVEQNAPPPPSLSIAGVQETVGTSGATTTMTFTVSLNEALDVRGHGHGLDGRPDRQGRHQLRGCLAGPHLCPGCAQRAVRRDDLRFNESRDGLLPGESHRWQRRDRHSTGLRDHCVLRPPLLLPDPSINT